MQEISERSREALEAENAELRSRIAELEKKLASSEDQRSKLLESVTAQAHFHSAYTAGLSRKKRGE